MSINAQHATRLLDVAPEPPREVAASDVRFVSMETVPHNTANCSPRSVGRLSQLFSYVSAARLSRSPRQRWEAIHSAVRMLWDDSDALGRSVTVAQLDQLCGMDPSALQSVLPQLLYYVLTHESPVAREVQDFLLRTCAASTKFGYELYWLLLAQPRPSCSADSAAAGASRLDQLMKSVARVLDLCAAPAPDSGWSRDGHQASGSGPGSAVSQFRRQLHLFQTLTAISEQLRSIERSQRLQVPAFLSARPCPEGHAHHPLLTRCPLASTSWACML